jgi:hypothetical protein
LETNLIKRNCVFEEGKGKMNPKHGAISIVFQFAFQTVKTKTYRTVIYGCEAWSKTFREGTLRVVRSRVLRKVYWSKKGEAIGHWRKGHCKELHDAYFS